MQQKVWFIDEPNWEDPPATEIGIEPEPAPPQQADRPATAPSARNPDRNPALSFSMAMLVWGSGHMYCGTYGVGAVLMVSMLMFYSPIAVMLLFRDVAGPFEAEIGSPTLFLVAGAVIYLFVGLVCWLGNAIDAYNRAVLLRAGPFKGVDNERWPLLGSLLFPGWGQYLNGQPGKGLVFLSFGAIGTLCGVYVGLVLYAIPGLEAEPGGVAFEISLIVAMLLIPVCFVMWLVSVYDGFKSSKELFIEKFRKYTPAARKRKRDAARQLIPRWNAVLVLLLTISVGMQCFPARFYVNALNKLRVESRKLHLQIIPKWADKALAMIDR